MPDDEAAELARVEVTAAMIEAGVDELCEQSLNNPEPEQLVARIYRQMETQRRFDAVEE